MSGTDYGTRYQAINDALWLIQHGPKNPEPPVEQQNARSYGMDLPMYASSTQSVREDDPRYAEVSLALDIARFLLSEELGEGEDERLPQTIVINGTADPAQIKDELVRLLRNRGGAA